METQLPASTYIPPKYLTLGDLIKDKCRQKKINVYRLCSLVDFDPGGMSRMLNTNRGISLHGLLKLLTVLDNITLDELKSLPQPSKTVEQ